MPRQKNTRRLINSESIDRFGLRTYQGTTLVYFLIRPTNLSVLSETAVRQKVQELMLATQAMQEVEWMALDSRENFETNREYLKRRIRQEPLPVLRALMEKDRAYLDQIQIQTATTREFLVCVRLKNYNEKEVYPYLNRLSKLMEEHGFDVRRADREDVKRLLAVYFTQSVVTEHYDDFDGERWLYGKPVEHPVPRLALPGKKQKKKKRLANWRGGSEQEQQLLDKEFLDMIAPSAVRFEQGRYVCGNMVRCVWAVREYPAVTNQTGLLQQIGAKAGVSLHMYLREVSPLEQQRILANAEKINKLRRANTEKLQDMVEAQNNLEDVAALISKANRDKEAFFHTAVFLELCAPDVDRLRQLQAEVEAALNAAKITVDKLLLRQREGFLCVMPSGYNVFREQFERVLPAGSVANLYPFAYSGKTDPNGFYIGKDKYGSSVIVDFDRRGQDKTNSSMIILGNSGEGKSYLLKLLLTCLLESGKTVLVLDPEAEYEELTDALGGCYLDLMSGAYRINVLQPRRWSETGDSDAAAPNAFRQKTILSQHISFLRDFFRSYKSFTDAEIDTIEIILQKLYERFGITEETDFQQLTAEDYPVLSDLHDLILEELEEYDPANRPLYTAEMLQSVALGLHSMCKGTDSSFFDGHTNISSERFLVFGVKGLLEASREIRNAMLFNVLSYMSGELLTKGNAVAGIDELYLFLSNPVAVEYIRNMMKRVRKKDSALLLASQNVNDFLQPGISEMTKPLFAIPTHQFLFFPGSINRREYTEALQLEENEYDLISTSRRGTCLYKCGVERYHLEVRAPEYKEKLFGTAGGR